MNEEKIASASVKELKAFISASGLDFKDCVTKNDLKARARDALVKVEERKDDIKSYPCKIMGDQSKPADLVVLFFHGYGATAENFAPLSTVIGVPGKNVIWVFPQADSSPISQWFPLEVNKMAMVRSSSNHEFSRNKINTMHIHHKGNDERTRRTSQDDS